MKNKEDQVKTAHISLDPQVYYLIENRRGLIKRSNYINALLREAFGLDSKLNEQKSIGIEIN
jgi:hypothetical protein